MAATLSIRVRILVVTQDFPPLTGGIQTYLGRLCDHLAPMCEHLSVVAPSCPGQRETDVALPYPVHRIRFHSSWLVVPLAFRLRQLVRTHRISHVLYAQWFPALAGGLLSAEIKQAAIVHGRELLNHPMGTVGLAFSSPVLRRMDAIFPNSAATAALLPDRLDPDRIHVVHPGVDCRNLTPPTPADLARFRERQNVSPEAPMVTTLARLVPRKGIDTLIRSVALLKHGMPDIRLLVGGSGPDLPRLQRMAHQAGVAEAVRFVGRIPSEDMSAFFACGVFALLSRQTARDVEGFGMVLTEAQACHAPVLAARSGGMPEAIGEGAGLVVDPDSPDQAASVLEALLMDPDRRGAMGLAGRRFAESLSWESRAGIFASVLEALI